MTALFQRLLRAAGPASAGLAIALLIGAGGACAVAAAPAACAMTCAAAPHADGGPTACPARCVVLGDAASTARCCVSAPASAVNTSAVTTDVHDLGAAAVPLRGAFPAGRLWRGSRHPDAPGPARAGFGAAHPCRAPPLHT